MKREQKNFSNTYCEKYFFVHLKSLFCTGNMIFVSESKVNSPHLYIFVGLVVVIFCKHLDRVTLIDQDGGPTSSYMEDQTKQETLFQFINI